MSKTHIVLFSETDIDRELLAKIINHLNLCYDYEEYDPYQDDELSVDEDRNDVFINSLRTIHKRYEFIRYFNELLEFGYDDDELNTEFQNYLASLEEEFQPW